MKSDGSAWAWGTGPLGDGTNGPRETPGRVSGGAWKTLAVDGTGGVGIRADGSLWFWGPRYPFTYSKGWDVVKVPERVGTATDWVSVAMGGGLNGVRAYAIKADGSLWGWASNDFGELRDGRKEESSRVRRIGSDSDWVSIAAGWGHMAGIRRDGTLWAWGNNEWGEVGIPPTKDRVTILTRVGTDTDWKTVACEGGAHRGHQAGRFPVGLGQQSCGSAG